jgi:hypothetical protein
MKNLGVLFVLILFTSCSSIRVFSDYDSSIDFTQYKTFSFFKPGIDELTISDLDKTRILNAIENELSTKQISTSKQPDLLVNVSVSAKDKVVITNNPIGWGWGWGWNPWFMGGSQNTVSTQTEGQLFIDIIDAKTKKLVWQGKGRGGIREYDQRRDERINQFVTEILSNFPPSREVN